MQNIKLKQLSISPWHVAQGIGFQAFWFACVLGQNSGITIAVALIFIHFYFSPEKLNDLKLLSLAPLGIAIDTAFSTTNVFIFNEFPFWLLLLWLGFVISLNHSLKYLRTLPIYTQAVIGAITGPLSYLTGERFSAVNFGLSMDTTLLILALVWAGLLPAFIFLSNNIQVKQ